MFVSSGFPFAQRYTSTGILEWVSTFCVSLADQKPRTPLRPWEAIIMRSHPFCSATRIMAS